MGIIEGLALVGTFLLGPAAGAAATLGITPPLVGAVALGGGTAAVIGGGGSAASVSHPFVFEGVENALIDAHNNLVSGSANILNGLQLPGIPPVHIN